jgi:pimeloyl-ACP methyl ester carboxylesterase
LGNPRPTPYSREILNFGGTEQNTKTRSRAQPPLNTIFNFYCFLVDTGDNGFLDVDHYGEKRSRRLNYGLVEDARQYEDFPNFGQPALIFNGLNDNVVPPQLSREFAASHPNARLHLLDSDHELLNVLDDIWQATGPFLLG